MLKKGEKFIKGKDPRKRTCRSIAKKMIKFFRILKRLKIPLEDILKHPILPAVPYQLKKTKKFLVAVNLGNIDAVRMMLEANRYLVYQIDSMGKSAVHRATKMANLEMLKMLMNFNPDLDACDYMGKTALSYAIESDNIFTATVKTHFLALWLF